MSGIILELQTDCLDQTIDLSDLLRKALLIAVKLNICDFKNWIKNELEGYADTPLPEYRKAPCQLVECNRLGTRTLILPTEPWKEKITSVSIPQSIAEIEVLKKNMEPKGYLRFPIADAELIQSLHNLYHTSELIERHAPQTALDKILNSVRSTLLQWALELEQQGILGENLSFTKTEKEKANNNSFISIASFNGILGDINNSTVSQHIAPSINNITDLLELLRKHNVSESDIKDLECAIKTDPKPTKHLGDKVNAWIVKMLGKAANGAWNISMSVASALLIKGLSQCFNLPF